jgi:hypothetical protein
MLTQAHVDYCQLMLTQSTKAKEYLSSRFLELDLTAFQLGYEPERDAISIPSYSSGTLVGIKYRLLGDSDMRYVAESGSQAGSYVLPAVDDSKACLIVEGEFDAITARLLGWTGLIVAVQTNRLTVKVRAEFKKLLKTIRWFYYCCDNDIPGQQLFESLRQFIPTSRLVEFALPADFKDLNEILQETQNIEESHRVFQSIIQRSMPAIVRDTAKFFDSIEQTVEFLSNKHNVKGDSSGIRLLDDKLGGGFRPHELTLINAVAKVGKTTFATQVMYNLASQGKKVGFASLEMDPITQVKPSFLSIALKTNIRKLSESELTETIGNAIDDVPQLDSIYFFNRYGVTPSQDISDWIAYGYEDLGITHFFIDHVGYSLEEQANISENAKLAKFLKALTRQFPIHIYAIVQPPKLVPNYKGELPLLGKDTLFGGASWGQAMDNLITLQRSKDNADMLEVRLTDSRYPLATPSDSAILLSYDRETCSLVI